jgi:hypothetical protein
MVQGSVQYNGVTIVSDMLDSSPQISSRSFITDVHTPYDFSGIHVPNDSYDHTWHELSTYNPTVEPSFPGILASNCPVEHRYRMTQSCGLSSHGESKSRTESNQNNKFNKSSTSSQATRRTTVRRRTQNRLAQRAYRKRKAEQIQELEARLADALTALQMLSSESGDGGQKRGCPAIENNMMQYWINPKLETFENEQSEALNDGNLSLNASDTLSENNLKHLLCADWVLESLSDQSTF